MKLLQVGYHARAVTLGCMTKGKWFSSLASLLISVKVLVGNVVSSGHHAKVVSPNYLLNKKKQIKIKKIQRMKAIMGLEKCIHDRDNSPSTKAPIGNTLHPWPLLHPHAWTSPDCIIHLHGLDEISLGTFLFSVDTSPIGSLVLFPRLILQACVMSLSY
jgi:hypothetical protein